jgi:hypothetical protein
MLVFPNHRVLSHPIKLSLYFEEREVLSPRSIWFGSEGISRCWDVMGTAYSLHV